MMRDESVLADAPSSPPPLVPPAPEGAGEPHEQLVALQAPLRRFVASRVRDSHLVDDIVQETMLRMLQVAARLEAGALSAYAFTVARNLIVAGARSEATARRNLPRLVDRHEPVRPDAAATDAEARRALGAALAKVTPSVRAQLLSRDLDRRPLHEVADESDLTSGVLASQLHRTRARLRVDYLLALRQVALPTKVCEKVLVAISAADRRRQADLEAGRHLDSCPVCSELSLPLVSRDHALAGWAPIPLIALGSLHGHLARLTSTHPTASAAAAGTGVVIAAAAVAAGVVLGSPSAGPTPPVGDARPSQVGSATATAGPTPQDPLAGAEKAPAPSGQPAPAVPDASVPTQDPGSRDEATMAVPGLSSPGGPVVAEAAQLKPLVGRAVRAHDVVVLAVPADEGFWVGRDQARMWVHLATRGESAVQIRAGQRLSFSAVVTANTTAFLAQSGPPVGEGQETLRRVAFHLEVAPNAITVR